MVRTGVGKRRAEVVGLSEVGICVVTASSVGKRGAEDEGRRWMASCTECSWFRYVKWKGGHAQAVGLARKHVCENPS
jgi:hypothetical protein